MSTLDPTEDVFNSAKRTFRDSLKDPRLYNELLETTTIGDVYKLTTKLQEDAASKGGLRHLARIRPFLDRVTAYAAIVDTFVQVKPEILALIWGPIRLLLLWSSQLTKALDAIVNAIAKIGLVLPHFTVMMETFASSDTVKAALALFYHDILDFYRIAFEFFRKPRWKYLFEAMWPNYTAKIDVVVSNLEQHSLLMRNEVTLIDIKEAHDARLRSIAHFTETHGFQELQKFHGLQARIGPTLYDERLDWLRNRSFAGGAKWLLRDPNFTEWLDVSKRGVVWLWLQGIPGAGKTFLAAAAIDAAKKLHRTLFVFVSHTNQSSLTALVVIQSLIFQAALEDKDFQAVLVESNERELKSNSEYALELLKTQLKSAESTAIVIDGLDEMEECERQILLRRLEELSKACDKLKILICSRAEDDITKALEKKAKSVRVDQKNSGSIQGYIAKRSQEWIARCELDTGTESEVLGLISPLSAKANGMFLYARIVLDNLEQMSSIDEILRELNALPTDLTDAYHRIFQRINTSRPQTRMKCRKILGWIGCAPVPLTIFEMEQALVIDPDTDSSNGIPSIMTSVSLVRMCGPIIEVADERPQFVHFTVKEYIFSQQISDFIDKFHANMDLAASCLAYLFSGLLETELSDADLEKNILSGRYRLLGYAIFHWPALVLHVLKGDDWIRPSLKRLLTRAALEARNYEFKDDADGPVPLFENEGLRLEFPESYEMLCATFRFHLDEKRADWNLSNGQEWINSDPLTTSQMLVRVQEKFDALICDRDTHGAGCDVRCAAMRRHYGCRLFKCTYPSCAYSRRGFKTKEECDRHLENHGRPWKCSDPMCQFAVIGFNTKGRRDHHWLRFHRSETTMATQASGGEGFQSLDADEIQPLLFRLVTEDDIDGVQRLLSCGGGADLKLEVIVAARLVAAEKGSLAITQLLAPKNETHVPANIVIAAVESEDAELVKWALSKAVPEDAEKFLKIMLDTKSDEIYSLYEDHLVALPPWRERPADGIGWGEPQELMKGFFKQSIISEVKDDTVKEARLKHTWKKLAEEHQLTTAHMGALLVCIAKSTCSIPLAKALVELGADIDFPRTRLDGVGMSALRIAARKTTQDAAVFMRFLLFEGARPYEDRGTHNTRDFFDIGKERGATMVAKWLGVTWDELVESARDHRSKLRRSSMDKEWDSSSP